jgi:hypothetical protein
VLGLGVSIKGLSRMTDNRNYLLVHDQDVPRVAEHIGRAMADIGVTLVTAETLGAHHAALHALRTGDVALEFGDAWHPFPVDRDLARPLSRRLGAPVASCFLDSRGEMESVRLFSAGKSLASYLIAGEPAEWKVTAGKRILRLEVEPTVPEDDDDEEVFDQQLAELRKLQAQAFRALPFSPLFQGSGWHELATTHSKTRGPAVELSFLDDAEDLEPARRFERQLAKAVGSSLARLGFRRTKARGFVSSPSHPMVSIAFARDFEGRRLHVTFFSRGALRGQRIDVDLQWLAWHKPRAAHLPTGQHMQLADGVRAAELAATFKRGLDVLQVFAPELGEDIEHVVDRSAQRRLSKRDQQRLWREHVVDTGQQLYELAMARRKSAQDDECRALLRSLIRQYPGNPRAADARERLRDEA